MGEQLAVGVDRAADEPAAVQAQQDPVGGRTVRLGPQHPHPVRHRLPVVDTTRLGGHITPVLVDVTQFRQGQRGIHRRDRVTASVVLDEQLCPGTSHHVHLVHPGDRPSGRLGTDAARTELWTPQRNRAAWPTADRGGGSECRSHG